MKKICVITGSRAEYGLLFNLLKGIDESPYLALQLVVTGSHLSPQHGDTWQEIADDGFKIDRQIDMQLASDKRSAVVKSMGLELIGLSDTFSSLAPDLVVLVGDRYEALGAAVASTLFGVPIVHIHGGEITTGAIDDSLRHAISKLASLHFTSTEEYRQRVIQMGENPETVINAGALAIDNFASSGLMAKRELEESLGISLNSRIFLVTFHPATRGNTSDTGTLESLFAALERVDGDSSIVFTLPNADPDNFAVAKQVESWCALNDSRHAFKSLGRLRYLSLLQLSHAVLGNSSSGIIEAPSFRVPTINIGNRQEGRTRADSIFDVEPNQVEILDAIKALEEPEIRNRINATVNPHGTGGAAATIVSHLTEVTPEDLRIKQFFDLAPEVM